MREIVGVGDEAFVVVAVIVVDGGVELGVVLVIVVEVVVETVVVVEEFLSGHGGQAVEGVAIGRISREEEEEAEEVEVHGARGRVEGMGGISEPVVTGKEEEVEEIGPASVGGVRGAKDGCERLINLTGSACEPIGREEKMGEL